MSEATLHESHRWGERPYFDGEEVYAIPVCLDCRVDGFENEPRAFAECSGPTEEVLKKAKKEPRTECRVKMESLDDPGHQHECLGGHTDGDHFCKSCRRWYNVRPDSPLAVP